MKLNIGSTAYRVEWVITEEFPERPFPFVYLSDGTLCYSLLSFLKHQYSLGLAKNTSSLTDLFRVVGEIKMFYNCLPSRHEKWLADPQILIIEYFEKRLYGTIRNNECSYGLWWKPSKNSTVRKLLRRFSEYEEYCHRYLDTAEINTSDVVTTAAIEYAKFQRKAKYDLLGHLTDYTQDPRFEKNTGMPNLSYENAENTGLRKQRCKYFPPEHIACLIDTAIDANQAAMYLLCAFAGLRESEAIQVLITDIVHRKGALLPDVILDHPVVGRTWDQESQKLMVRSDYLRTFNNPDFYQIGLSEKELNYVRAPIPRCNQPKPFRAGFKSVELEHYHEPFGYLVEWSNAFAQLKFFELLNSTVLLQERANHPFLFCSKNGAPLKLSCYEQRLSRQSKRITGTSHGTHSLRHFCGFYLNNTLNFTINMAKVFMRHKSITSTMKYFHTSAEKLKSALTGEAKINKWASLDFSMWGKR